MFFSGPLRLPTTTIRTDSRMNGIHAWNVAPAPIRFIGTNGSGGGPSTCTEEDEAAASTVGRFPWVSKRQTCFGFQKQRNRAVTTSEISPPAISVSGNDEECAKKNWHSAKETPETAIAGRTSTVSFQEHMQRTSQSGTRQDRNGSWLPAILLR